MLSDDQVTQFIEKSERELNEYDKKIEAIGEALAKHEIPTDPEIVEEAKKRLKEAEIQAEREAGQTVSQLNDSIDTPAKPSVSRRNRGLAV